MKKRTLYVTSAFLLLLLVNFQNCGLVDSKHVDASSFATGCLSSVDQAFKQTYYKQVRANCIPCHDNNGRGIGWFASADPTYALNAFLTTTRAKIDMMMVYDGHSGPNNGPAMQPFIDMNKRRWEALDAQTDMCSGENIIQTIGKNTPLKTIAIAANNGDPNRRPWRVLEWNLFTDIKKESLRSQIHLIATIQYREAQANGVDIGYEFSAPTARVADDAAEGTQYAISNISIYLNDKLLASASAFQSIKGFVVGKTTDANGQLLIDAGSSPGIVGLDAAGVAIKSLSTDLVGLRFGEIRPANGEPLSTLDVGGGTVTPLPTRVTFIDLSNSVGQYGYVARSCVNCHKGATPSGGLDLTNFAAAAAAKAKIKSRVNNNLNPMPPMGLLPQYDRDVISLWVDLGAPQM